MDRTKQSVNEWVGDIPENWEEKPIRYIFNEIKEKNKLGTVTKALKFTYGTIIPKTNFDADEDNYVANTILTYTIVSPGTIMINCLNLNYDFVSQRIGLVKDDGVITSAYLPIKPLDEDIIDSEYANFQLKAWDNVKAFHNMGSGVRKTLDFTELGKKYILIPPIEVQKKIVKFLNRKCSEIDILYSDIEKQVETLEEYKKSVITEAVTKGLNPDVEMKDSGIEWIGEISKDWDISRLKYELETPMKYGASESGVDYSDDLPRYIRITDITTDNKLKEEGKLSLTFEQANGYMLEKDTILFARSGGTVGKTFLYTPQYGKAAFAGYLISGIPNKNRMMAKWLYYYTLSNAYWDWANRIFTQATIQNIGADKYSNLPITIPSITEQNNIINYLDTKCLEIDKVIEDKKAQLETLEEYKKSLIYEYVTGKKEVPDNE